MPTSYQCFRSDRRVLPGVAENLHPTLQLGKTETGRNRHGTGSTGIFEFYDRYILSNWPQ